MPNFIRELSKRIRDGVYKRTLKDYCFQWRDNPTEYAINNVIRFAIEDDRFDILRKTLEDHEYREQRKSVGGINSLRTDLKWGLDYFGHHKNDLLHYLRLLFLDTSIQTDDVDTIPVQQNYCNEFSLFLQLDRPETDRTNVGLHRVLDSVFPLSLVSQDDNEKSQTDASIAFAPTRVELVYYTLGDWRCRCGKTSGFKDRYKFGCSCGNIEGYGQLPGRNKNCNNCGELLSYKRCSLCNSRVTLDIIWKLEEIVHPTDCLIPLVVHLRIISANSSEDLEMELMRFPILLGIREINDKIEFDFPALMWLDRTTWSDIDESIFAFQDQLRYDRQTSLCSVLEAVLRRTFQSFGDKHRSLKELFKKSFIHHKITIEEICNRLSGSFQRRISSNYNCICYRFHHAGDLVKRSNQSFECTIAAAPGLQSNMAVVNCQLLLSNKLVVDSAKSFVTVLSNQTTAQRLAQELTAEPGRRVQADSLDEDGIIRIGAKVFPGDVLVGIRRPKIQEDLNAEEKLLRAIFGEVQENFIDESLRYEGSMPATVMSVVVDLDPNMKIRNHKKEHGKIVRSGMNAQLGYNLLARITITLAIEHRPAIGDKLYATDNSFIVICDQYNSATINELARTTDEPDILVAHDHPWAPKDSLCLTRTLLTSTRSENLLIHHIERRGIGPYNLVDQEPLYNSGAQELNTSQIEWLVSHNAETVAQELVGPHSDCMNWGLLLYQNIVYGNGSLVSRALHAPPESQRINSAKFKRLAYLLKAASIIFSIEQSQCTFNLAGPKWILEQSHGEVKVVETINYSTGLPVKDGLFCERIFGPLKDYECSCGKYRKFGHRGMTCGTCGVDVISKSKRRERFGHIALCIPVVHTWYYHGENSLLSKLLDIDSSDLEKVILYEAYVVLNPGQTPLISNQILSNEDYREAKLEFGNSFEAEIGAFAVKQLLTKLDLNDIIKTLRRNMAKCSNEKEEKTLNEQLRVVVGCQKNHGALAHIVHDILFVLPPDLRPLIPFRNGKYVTSDLNDLYRRVISRNKRLRRLIELSAPEIVIHDSKRMLQQSIDRLFKNSVLPYAALAPMKRPLVSICDEIQRNHIFYKTLLDRILNKRIDFSGKTYIVTANTESIDHALLPEFLAWELFKPLTLRQLIAEGCPTIKSAKNEITQRSDLAKRALQQTCTNTVILAAIKNVHWPLFSLRVSLSKEKALGVNEKLFDQLGWELLGQDVQVFAIHSHEAQSVATSRLLPNILQDRNLSNDKPASAKHKIHSVLNVKTEQSINIFCERALYGQAFTKTIYDSLAACEVI